jgi:hypothetical protein
VRPADLIIPSAPQGPARAARVGARKGRPALADSISVKCPNCSLDCFPQAKRCQCGHNFENPGKPYKGLPAIPAETSFAPPGGGSGDGAGGANGKILLGLLFLVGGIAVTVLTYQSAASSPGGGKYIIAHGPIIFGAIQLLRGIGGLTKR